MKRIYIENACSWEKKQKKIDQLLSIPNDKLTLKERLELIYDKYLKGQKITYDEYVLLLTTNDEIWFAYKGIEYQVCHESKDATTMVITEFKDGKKVSERSEIFSSTNDLLDKFKIEGKNIRDIWNETTN